MSSLLEQRIVRILKFCSLISFLCIVIDNGKFEVPMAFIILVAGLAGFEMIDASNSFAYIVPIILGLLYCLLLWASLAYLFITAITSGLPKRRTTLSLLALSVLWVQLGFTVDTSFVYPSSIVLLTHGIFASLSMATIIFICITAMRKRKIASGL